MSPPWLHLPGTPFEVEGVPLVGIAIRKTEPGWHAGLLYVRGASPWLLHLAWHHDLRNEDFPHSRYAWVRLDILPPRTRTVTAYCRRVWKRHEAGGLPYGLRFKATAFEKDGALLLGSTEHGLTCATFLIALLRSAGVELLNLETWREREDDAEWQELIVDTLRQNGASESHVAAVEKEIGCARFRPEEVAGAASCKPFPVAFDDAWRAGRGIVTALSPGRASGGRAEDVLRRRYGC